MQVIENSGTQQRMPTIVADDPVVVIQGIVRDFFHVSKRELLGPSKVRRISWSRQIAMALIKQKTSRSLPDIGRCFGGRDHTTVMHAVRAVAQRRKDCRDYEADFAEIDRRVELALGGTYVRRKDILGKPFVSVRGKGKIHV